MKDLESVKSLGKVFRIGLRVLQLKVNLCQDTVVMSEVQCCLHITSILMQASTCFCQTAGQHIIFHVEIF